MTLIEKLSNLGGIVDRDEMAKACSEIPDKIEAICEEIGYDNAY